jgi:4-hydroxybenzoate polyprenyltransferase
MKKTLLAYYHLLRPREYLFFTLTYTLLGAAATQSPFGWRWVLVFLANFFAVAFAFVFNQITDAPLDALSESDSAVRNPIATGELSFTISQISAVSLFVISIILYAFLGWKTLLAGLLTLAIGALYSWGGLRLKGIALLDLSAHCWLLATPVFLAGFFAQKSYSGSTLSFLLPFVLFISLFGQLTHESRNIPKLGLAQPQHSVLIHQRSRVHLLMMIFLGIGSICGVIALFIQQVIPIWVTFLWFLLSCILILPSLIRTARDPNTFYVRPALHTELEKAAAFALLANILAEILIRIIH